MPLTFLLQYHTYRASFYRLTFQHPSATFTVHPALGEIACSSTLTLPALNLSYIIITPILTLFYYTYQSNFLPRNTTQNGNEICQVPKMKKKSQQRYTSNYRSQRPKSHIRRANKPISPQNIDDLSTFVQGYKKLQSDNAHLQAQVAEHVATIEQAQKFFCDAEEALQERKARNKEIKLLRKEKIVIKDQNEELMYENASSRLRYKKLTNFSLRLEKRVHDLEKDVKASAESLEEYKKRVKALADEAQQSHTSPYTLKQSPGFQEFYRFNE